MKKRYLAAMAVAAMMSTSVWAADQGTVLEKTDVLETTVYGQEQQGALVDRVNQLDETVYGALRSGSLTSKVDALYDSVEGQGTTVSLRQELDVLEWLYADRINQGSLVSRIEQLERSVSGRVEKGPLDKRFKQLERTITGSTLKLTAAPATIAENHVFKVTLNDPISTKRNVVGDTFKFTVAEDIMDGNALIVPAGTVGTGTISELKKARSFGRNAKLDLVFNEVPTIDGGSFEAIQGKDAKEKTENELKAAGASVAGVVLLGPVGLVGGFFVHGSSIELPAGAALYVQPEAEVSTTGITVMPDTSDPTAAPVTPQATQAAAAPATRDATSAPTADTTNASTADTASATTGSTATAAATGTAAAPAADASTTKQTTTKKDPNAPIVVVKRSN